MQAFHKKYSLKQRQEKSSKQIEDNPGKLPLIAEPHPKSSLPPLSNPKFLCESHYKFNVVSNILKKKVDKVKGKSQKQSENALFVYVKNNIINGQQTIESLYNRLKHEDGFLYITYGQMETFG